MPKKSRGQLSYSSWRRRLQSALVDLEGATRLWSGCVSEAVDCGDEGDPRLAFVRAMDDGRFGLERGVPDELGLRLRSLAEETAQAVERGKGWLKAKEEAGGD